MINPIRKEILERLYRISELDTDVRFGQLVVNLATFTDGPYQGDIWNIEDEQILETIRQIESDLVRRDEAVAAA